MSSQDEFYTMMKCPTVGHNGGNPNADLWFCGLEHGGEMECCKRENKKKLKMPDRKISFRNNRKGFFNNFYKILEALDLNHSQYPNELFNKDSRFYSANLYPFGFPGIHFGTNKEIHKLTGLKNKTQYQYLCDLLRKESNEPLLTPNHNRVIVCFSKSFMEDFLVQFVHSDDKLGSAIIQCWEHHANNPDEKYFKVDINSDTIKAMIFCPHLCARGFKCENLIELIKSTGWKL
ncbi:MAG: hypothetical protein LBJ18_00365 [Rickettsiales bacterium]|jgi:hypothetical protein|nr:hypothetical protein [Rickettsiales bacterium]